MGAKMLLMTEQLVNENLSVKPAERRFVATMLSMFARQRANKVSCQVSRQHCEIYFEADQWHRRSAID
ncbi:hypothetical protein B5K05_13455 [Rhizobium phaseoli]|nr:hypothetical protein B5K04_13430 [Rhizobium phaseoli]RDJ14132.1 hypothetical protein B5K05_13455 [Rhizobium phaseoli]